MAGSASCRTGSTSPGERVTAGALALVVVAAFCHATWNLLAKQARGGVEFTWLFLIVSSVVFAPVALVVVIVTTPRWGLDQSVAVGVTAVMHLAYYLVLQRGYAHGDLSVVYPIARGTGPLLSVFVGALVFGERLTAGGIAGALLVVGGVLIIVNPFSASGPPTGASLRYGLLTGTIIAAYTIMDTRSVARLGIPPLLLDWSANTVRAGLLTPLVFRRRDAVRAAWATHRKAAVGIGVLSSAAYVLVLTALTMSPVSRVAPAREVSIVVGAWLGGRVLGEGDGPRRIAASVVVVAGVLLLAFA